MGTVAREKVGELEDEVRELFSRHMRKDLTVLVESVSGKRELLVIFQYGCDKYPKLNQLTFVTVDRIPVTKESKVTMIYLKLEE